MGQQEIDAYFYEIGAWMRNDIRREIELARVSQSQAGTDALTRLGIPAGGGNLLAALGLVAYTEALGLLRVWNTTNHRYGTPSECFMSFFGKMAGGRYKTWWDGWPGSGGKSVYDVLRNGLVHEYRPKVDAGFWIGSGDDLGLAEEGGVLIFRISAYYRDFCAEMDDLHRQLREMPNAEVPPPSGTSARPSGAGSPTVSPSS